MRVTINFRKRLSLFLGGTIFFFSAVFAQGSVKQSAHSVVSITARSAKGAGQGTGFVWSQPTYVVTALHVIAGASQIEVYSQSKKRSTEAKPIAAHLESDLALLQLKTDIGLTPLSHANTDPGSSDEYYIWGYPRGVASMEGRPLRFSMSLEASPTLESIFKSSSQFKKELGNQGYPAFTAKILRINTNIQPGHSGAPIFDKTGRVVGIGDGGLRDGAAGINWAIPSMIYLPTLPSSKDPIPVDPSLQNTLFGFHEEEPVKIPYGKAQSASPTYTVPEEPEATPGDPGEESDDFQWEESYSEQALYKVWEAPMREIILTSDEEIVNLYNILNAEAIKETGRSLDDAIIEVYEDYVTGATIAVPQGVGMEYDNTTHMLVAAAGGEETDVYMIVQISINDNWDDARSALSAYQAALDELAAWQKAPEPEFADDEEFNENESYAYVSHYRMVPGEENNPLSEMNRTMVIDQNDFLGTAVIANNVPQFTADEWYHWYLMSMCVELANFSIH